MVLDTDENATKNVLAYDHGHLTCSTVTFNIDNNKLNGCNGSSSSCSKWDNIYFSTIISNDFISTNVSLT